MRNIPKITLRTTVLIFVLSQSEFSVSGAMMLQPPYSKRTNALKWKTSLIHDKAYADTYTAG